MKITVSLLFGLLSGWMLTNVSKITPNEIETFIGTSIASSKYIQYLTSYISPDVHIAENIHIWIIALGMALPVIVLNSCSAVLVASWTQKTRLIAYSSLVYPLYLIFGASFIVRAVSTDEQLRHSLTNVFSDNLAEYISNLIVYFALLYLFSFWVKKRNSQIQKNTQEQNNT